MKLAFVFGTRPEIIKLAPLFLLAKERDIPYILIHTNQHYSEELDAIFFTELGLPQPQYNLQIGPGNQSEQTARMIERLEPILTSEKPSTVLVQGDTNSVLAGALVAAKLNIPVSHIEAGLRSYDRTMPEEINRIITDHISSYLFPPTAGARTILQSEGITEQVHVVGNTVVDTVLAISKTLSPSSLKPFGLAPKKFCLLTMHRPSNVDTAADLKAIIKVLDETYLKLKLPFFFPIHPRTQHSLEKNSIVLPDYIQVHKPVGYRDMLTLQKYAAFVLTDSGGLQEESCILGTPCMTLRENTERPETVAVGASALIGHDSTKIGPAIRSFAKHPTWKNPFGDGTASQQIIAILAKNLPEGSSRFS